MFRRQIPTPTFSMASTHNPQDDIRPSRVPLRDGMEYSMDYDTRKMQAPNVPPPVRRQSLAQQVLIHRYQMSRYLSRLRYYGLRPDYPAFHGFVTLHQSNAGRTQPRFSNPPMNTPHALSGSMGAPRRFKKALPTKPVQYSPPVY